MSSSAFPSASQFIESNGVRLHVLQAGSPQGELLILLHGFPEFSGGWKHQIQALVDAGYWVWIPDQRGYNLSEKPAAVEAYAIQTLAKDVVGLISAAQREHAILVAHDWGGAVAWWVASFYPQHVKKMVILNVPHPSIMQKMMYQERFWLQFLKSWYFLFFQLPRLPEWFMLHGLGMWFMRGTALRGAFSPEDVANYQVAWRQTGAMTAMLNWYRATFRRAPQPAKRDKPRSALEVRVPTRIIWGKRDAFMHWSMAERSHQICTQGDLIFLEEATHWLHHEFPARVNTLILEFLEGKHDGR